MAEHTLMCGREIVDEADGRYRWEIEDGEVLSALHVASVRVITALPVNAKFSRVFCQIEGCEAECRLFEYEDGSFSFEAREGLSFESDPIPEEECAKIRSSW